MSGEYLVWGKCWALGYNSMKFRDFPDLSEFFKYLSLKSFGNSCGSSYILCLKLITTLRSTCGEKNLIKYQNVSKYYVNDCGNQFFILSPHFQVPKRKVEKF